MKANLMKTLWLIILVGGLGAGCSNINNESGNSGKPGAANPPGAVTPKPNPSPVVAPAPDRSAEILEKAIRRILRNPKGELTQADLEKVTKLSLFATEITDAGLKEVAKLQQLTALNLGACRQITDAGLKEVAKLQQLIRLNLYSCKQITDAGIQELAKLPQLTWLDLRRTKITDAAVAELKKALPNCQIIN